LKRKGSQPKTVGYRTAGWSARVDATQPYPTITLMEVPDPVARQFQAEPIDRRQHGRDFMGVRTV
jgi:hypothetical protein